MAELPELMVNLQGLPVRDLSPSFSAAYPYFYGIKLLYVYLQNHFYQELHRRIGCLNFSVGLQVLYLVYHHLDVEVLEVLVNSNSCLPFQLVIHIEN